jgi:pyrroline-5-carboxylate reductase
MGSALARGAAKSGLADRLLLANRSPEKARRLAEELGGEVVDNRRAAAESDLLFLGVKPQMLAGMLDGIRDVLEVRRDRFVIVSMCAGKDLKTLSSLLGDRPIIRIMPNIPVAVGSGVTLMTASPLVTEGEKALLKELLGATGLVSELEEHLMDAAGFTGCGPAFAAMFVEALSDGAVACGLPRRLALDYAAQMLKGTAELLLETGEHPALLKDRVCSPAGSTIQGVRRLEESGFRAAVMNAVIACYEKKF